MLVLTCKLYKQVIHRNVDFLFKILTNILIGIKIKIRNENMKRTYFLDKIFNANHNEFEGIIKTIIKEEVGFKEFQYTFFKKKDKWVIDIETGEDLIISVNMPKKKLYLKVWKIQVGRVSLYLLDSDIEENIEEYNKKLYILSDTGEGLLVYRKIIKGVL